MKQVEKIPVTLSSNYRKSIKFGFSYRQVQPKATSL